MIRKRPIDGKLSIITGVTMIHPFTRRDWGIAAVCALLIAFVTVRALVPRPTYLDSFYHYNAAARLASDTKSDARSLPPTLQRGM